MTDTDDDLLAKVDAWVTRRNAAFEADDLQWAKDLLPQVDDPETLAWAFHRARAICFAVSMPKRLTSNEWLRVHGYKQVAL